VRLAVTQRGELEFNPFHFVTESDTTNPEK
jgi:hypothetical protein